MNYGVCQQCQKNLIKWQKKFCSFQCQMEQKYLLFILAWKEGTKNGGIGIHARAISGHVRRYLARKYGERCSLCGWDKKNSVTGKVPLEIDHIDGNSENNTETNLRLICPNCHALTPKFKNLNKGKGRKWRKDKYVKNLPGRAVEKKNKPQRMEIPAKNAIV